MRAKRKQVYSATEKRRRALIDNAITATALRWHHGEVKDGIAIPQTSDEMSGKWLDAINVWNDGANLLDAHLGPAGVSGHPSPHGRFRPDVAYSSANI